MTNIYQKLYKSSCRGKLATDEYAFITYPDEPKMFSIVKANRLINVDADGYGTIKDKTKFYRIEVIEKGKVF